MVTTEKVVKNAGSHRILHALSVRDCNSKDLKRIVGAINSIKKFDGEYMTRLVLRQYVEKVDGDKWRITPRGLAKFDELGLAEGMPGMKAGRESSWKERGLYVGKRETPMRIGAEDFLALPSRVGDFLYYRDGRKEHINANRG